MSAMPNRMYRYMEIERVCEVDSESGVFFSFLSKGGAHKIGK